MADLIPVDSHSELPPSSSDKWMKCGAWLRLNHGRPDSTSAAAEEGTRAHLVFEKLILDEDVPAGTTVETLTHLATGMDYIYDVLKEGAEVFAETRVDFGDQFGYVDLTGTADAIILDPDCLTILDLKFGMGLVEVEDNTQLMIYLSGAVALFGQRDRYRIGIFQPRAYHKDGPLRFQEVSAETLQEFNVALEAAIAANYKGGKAHVGPWCRNWCKALGNCAAVAHANLHLIRTTEID